MHALRSDGATARPCSTIRSMLVYGGFSQRCETIVMTLWALDVRDNTWMEIYEVGEARSARPRASGGVFGLSVMAKDTRVSQL